MTDINALETRVRDLERHNRHLRWTALLTLVLAVLALMWGRLWPANGVVEARSFVVTDPDGSPRGSFGYDQGGVGINLQDGRGMWRAGLLVDPTGRPAMFLFDTVAQPVVSLILQSSGAPMLRLRSPDDSAAIQLRVGAGAERGVFLASGADTASLTLPRAPTQP